MFGRNNKPQANDNAILMTPEQLEEIVRKRIQFELAAQAGAQAATTPEVIETSTSGKETEMFDEKIHHFVGTVFGVYKTPAKDGSDRYAMNAGGFMGRAIHKDGSHHVMAKFGATWRDGKPVDTSECLTYIYLDDATAEMLMDEVEGLDNPNGIQIHVYGTLEHTGEDRVGTFKGRQYLQQDARIHMACNPVLVKRGDAAWVTAYQIQEINVEADLPQVEAKKLMAPASERLKAINEARLEAARKDAEAKAKAAQAGANAAMGDHKPEAKPEAVQEWG